MEEGIILTPRGTFYFYVPRNKLLKILVLSSCNLIRIPGYTDVSSGKEEREDDDRNTINKSLDKENRVEQDLKSKSKLRSLDDFEIYLQEDRRV